MLSMHPEILAQVVLSEDAVRWQAGRLRQQILGKSQENWYVVLRVLFCHRLFLEIGLVGNVDDFIKHADAFFGLFQTRLKNSYPNFRPAPSNP